MCCYSVMADHYKRHFFPPEPYPHPGVPVIPPIDRETLNKLREVLEAVRKIDEKLGTADCGPEKVKDLLDALEARVTKLEREQKNKHKSGPHTLGMP